MIISVIDIVMHPLWSPFKEDWLLRCREYNQHKASSFQPHHVNLSYRKQPHPRSCPSQDSLYLVTEREA